MFTSGYEAGKHTIFKFRRKTDKGKNKTLMHKIADFGLSLNLEEGSQHSYVGTW